MKKTTTTKKGPPVLINFLVHDPELLERLEDYWHAQHFPNRGEAIRFLLDYAMSKNPKRS